MSKTNKNAMCLLGVVSLLAILGCSIYTTKANDLVYEMLSDKQGIDANDTMKRQDAYDKQVEEILSAMSTTEKIGQLMVIGISGSIFDDDARYVLQQFHYGGVILFDRNLDSKEQTEKLIMDIQTGANEKLPLFIAIDEEGGIVSRGKSFIPVPPSAELVGQRNPEYAESLAASVANDLKPLGINVNFAPVADLGSPGGRSYSTNPHEVLKFIKSIGKGYHSEGLIYTLKHFPGIGRGVLDSHKEISSINASEEELRETDLVPFQEMISTTDNGRNLDYMVMVGHLMYPAFDRENPASMSRPIITGLLREEFDYQGIIITDDLEMGAVSNHLAFREAGLKAIQAGVDVVLVCHEYAHAEETYMGIYNAVQEGIITEERLNESVRRVIKAKLTHGLNP